MDDREQINEIIRNFEKTNGKSINGFTTKEIVVLFHNQVLSECKSIREVIQAHLGDSEIKYHGGLDLIHKHDQLIQKVTDQLLYIEKELPSKGWCEKINKTLYAEDGADKMELLWNDRRWIKAIIAGIVGSLGLSAVNLVITIF
jgi:hypothetical protein